MITKTQSYNAGYEWATLYGNINDNKLSITTACAAFFGTNYELIQMDLRSQWLMGFRNGWLEKCV